MTYWKLLIAISKETRHINHATEGFLMLSESVLLSPRKATEI